MYKKQASAVHSILLAGICLIASSCANDNNSEYRHTLFVFGTLIEITLYDTTQAKAYSAFERLENDFHAYHASWTPWEDSELSRLNESIRAGDSPSVSGEVLPLITR